MNDINLTPIKNSLYLKKITTKNDLSKNDDCEGYLIDAPEKECRRIIDALKKSDKKIAVIGADNTFNRRALETLNINYLVNPEGGRKKDTLKQRDSGLNHVLATIATKKNVSVIISVSDLADLEPMNKAKRLSRIIQNINICRKTRCCIKLVSLTTNKKKVMDVKARQALGMSLGMSSQQATTAIAIE